jgi:DNA modification methylase
MLPINQILQGDCTRVLRTLPNDVVDLVVTDPPYGVVQRFFRTFFESVAVDPIFKPLPPALPG